ncbi:hypothetical protein ESCNG_430009 [Neisseria gonorrhoeae]|uniref:Uncharacterized protein n=1 Tax=Neisseria gonorrhoeae TaxID=485 RepID=A0AB74EPK4_NEIGO|nr:hypothetical protein ESCNG_200044 [Neisseria gonorrhoeae]SCW17573.1 hypothetical protein ESCNG_450002 [Neisseria gonorrhoeae]SCW19186.1 hypothetical protein ESCNG_430009 [Neisseria gonorrhoeae]
MGTPKKWDYPQKLGGTTPGKWGYYHPQKLGVYKTHYKTH